MLHRLWYCHIFCSKCPINPTFKQTAERKSKHFQNTNPQPKLENVWVEKRWEGDSSQPEGLLKLLKTVGRTTRQQPVPEGNQVL